MLGDSRRVAQSCRLASNLGRGREALDAEPGRGLPLGPFDDAPGVEAPDVVAGRPARPPDEGPGVEAPDGVARRFGRDLAAPRPAPERRNNSRSLCCLARLAIAAAPPAAASAASAPPKRLDKAPAARPDQQVVATLVARFRCVAARNRKVLLPTLGAGSRCTAWRKLS